MSKAREEKAQQIEEIKAAIKNSSAFVIMEYKGLTVAEVTEMRNDYRKAKCEYHVYKNRLLLIALNELGFKGYEQALNGANAIALSMSSDIGSVAKIALDKQKSFKKLTIKCGQVEGTFLDESGVKALATMPSREGLISQVLGLLLSPISGLARVINAIAEKKTA